MTEETLLTQDDVAKILQVSISIVRRLMHQDKVLKFIKVRGQVRIRKADLDEYLSKR